MYSLFITKNLAIAGVSIPVKLVGEAARDGEMTTMIDD
jgi:hypothetical protein